MNPTSESIDARKSFRKQILRPLPFRFYLLTKLPAAFFLGLRIDALTEDVCQVSLPYNYRTKNPFRSIYFAAQAAAAELSTGVLARMAIQGTDPMSMLIINMESEFLKKATTRTVFTCKNGKEMLEAVETAQKTGEAVILTAQTEGIQETGEIVSRMRFTWSFKSKV